MPTLKHYGLVAVLLSTGLSGCASMGLGDSEYSCKGFPDERTCFSAREAYERSHEDLDTLAVRKRASNPGAVSVEEHARTIRPEQQPMPVPHIDDGAVPIRTPARTMRIWLAPWEDQHHNLQVLGRVYTEIEPRQWVIGLPAKTVSSQLRLLQEAQALSGDPRKEAAGKDRREARRKEHRDQPQETYANEVQY